MRIDSSSFYILLLYYVTYEYIIYNIMQFTYKKNEENIMSKIHKKIY